MLEYLLKDAGVQVNAVDRFGYTPLEDAVRHNKGTAKVLQPREREFCIDNILVQIHLITEMIKVDWPGAMGV